MSESPKNERLESELRTLTELSESSSLFSFDSSGTPPNRYTLRFSGKGLRRSPSGLNQVDETENHECELQIPFGYPDREPEVRWLTPVFHPNVSFSGLIKLTDIGIQWQEGITLDVVCERLWDVARLAYLDLDRPMHHAAKDWFEDNNTYDLPVDKRAIRDKKAPDASNIVKYSRRGDQAIEAEPIETAPVHFIGEEPADVQPPPIAAPIVQQKPTKKSPPNDDIFFID